MKAKTIKFIRVAVILIVGLCSYNFAMAQPPSYIGCPPEPENLGFCTYWFAGFGPTVVCPGTTYTYTIQMYPIKDWPRVCWETVGGTIWSQSMDETTGFATAEISWTDGPGQETIQVFQSDVDYDENGNNGIAQCFRSAVLPVTVKPKVEIRVGTGGNINVCEWGPGVSLWANFRSATSYVWKRGTTVVQNGGYKYVAKLEGSYTVTTTFDGCTQVSEPINVNLIERPNLFIASALPYSCHNNAPRIELSGSQTGITYLLRTSGGSLLQPMPGSDGQKVIWTTPPTGQDLWVTARKIENGVTCYQDMAGSPVNVNSIPASPKQFNVGGTGVYCIGEGGRAVTLSGSESTVLYTLKRTNGSVITTMNGTGMPLVFPLQLTGDYMVTGAFTTGSCAPRDMLLVANITESALPALYTVTADDYCRGQLGGKVRLSNSQTGIQYQLHKNGVPWGDPPLNGTDGSALEWLNISPGGPYSVVGTNASGCRRTMTGPSVKTLEPKLFDVTGGGTACGAITETIDLSGSELLVNYELRKDDAGTGVIIAGTGNPISWPSITAPGVYTVRATRTGIANCSNDMRLSATVTPGPVIGMTVSKYPCTTHFAPVLTQLNDCGLSTFSWNFGDGGTSTLPEPFHAYAANGTYTATLTVTSTCNGVSCSNTTQQQVVIAPYTYQNTTIQVTTDQRPGIISTQASTFSDSWVLPYELQTLAAMNPFVNGERGVWRNESEYAYKAIRSQSPSINLATDGTFTMDFFNWRQASLDGLPNWIKTNEITRYSPFSYALEDKDATSTYSGAIYDYGGDLASAEGKNMRNDEMGFTGFETVSGTMTGNFNMGSSSVQTSITVPVLAGYGHMAIGWGPITAFSNYSEADVRAFHIAPLSFFGKITSKVLTNNSIICRQAYSVNNSYTVFVFDEAPFPGSWLGDLTMRAPFTATVPFTRDQTYVHTGAYSLKITTPTQFPQGILKLDQNKSYLISAWVSVGNTSVTAPAAFNNTGIDIIIRDKNNLVVPPTISFQTSGPIIEGWRQVTGTFSMPVPEGRITIALRPGDAGTAYFDDLRVHPTNGAMKSFVYDLKDYRLTAILDEQNYASLFYYDAEGNLYLTKKDTDRGRKTIGENVTYVKE